MYSTACGSSMRHAGSIELAVIATSMSSTVREKLSQLAAHTRRVDVIGCAHEGACHQRSRASAPNPRRSRIHFSCIEKASLVRIVRLHALLAERRGSICARARPALIAFARRPRSLPTFPHRPACRACRNGGSHPLADPLPRGRARRCSRRSQSARCPDRAHRGRRSSRAAVRCRVRCGSAARRDRAKRPAAHAAPTDETVGRFIPTTPNMEAGLRTEPPYRSDRHGTNLPRRAARPLEEPPQK